MAARRSIAAAAGGLHTAHRTTFEPHQGGLAWSVFDRATLLGADPPHNNVDLRATI
jgi:hypothetical protein